MGSDSKPGTTQSRRKWVRQLNSLTVSQLALARRLSEAGIVSFSSAVRAMAEGEDITAWKDELRGIERAAEQAKKKESK